MENRKQIDRHPKGPPLQNVTRAESPAPDPHVINPVLDRLLNLRRGDRVAWLAEVRRALARFPDFERIDRSALLRRIAVRDALNRIVWRLETRFPSIAIALARLAIIDDKEKLVEKVASERPIVFAMMHFGQIHYVITVAMRLLLGRTVYIFHAGGERGNAAAKFLERIGTIPIVTDRGALATAEAAILADPRSAVIVCFDHLGGRKRQPVSFLGSTLLVPDGLARLTETTGATVVTAWWETARGFPRLRVGGAYEIDATLEPEDRARDLTERMFRVLEERVREAPHEWTEWQSA